MLVLICSECGKKLGVNKDLQVGQAFRCTGCKSTFRLNDMEPAPPAEPEEVVIPARPMTQTKKKAGMSGWLVTMLAIASFLAVLGVGMAVLLIIFPQTNNSGIASRDNSIKNGTRDKQAKKQPEKKQPEKKQPEKKQPEQKQQQPNSDPALLTGPVLKKVKSATVLVRTDTEQGQLSGTGFFAIADGLVLTNAKNLGLDADQRNLPQRVQVVVYSGQATEEPLNSKILSVDRKSDLAVLQVMPGESPLPQPLTITAANTLQQTQKVFIVGFPFGEKLGKNITVGDSSVTNLSDNSLGQTELIQVNGGIHTGNSGGPVVNARGEVVGVAIDKKKPIHFAVAGEQVLELIRGKVLDVRLQSPKMNDNQLSLPIRIDLFDPLRALQQVEIVWWIGSAGNPSKVVIPQARTTTTLQYQSDSGSGNARLTFPPTISSGDVLWYQIRFINATKQIQLSQPAFLDIPSVLRPDEVNLVHNQQKSSGSLRKMIYAPMALHVKSQFSKSDLPLSSAAGYGYMVDMYSKVNILTNKNKDSKNPYRYFMYIQSLNLSETRDGQDIPLSTERMRLQRMGDDLNLSGEVNDKGLFVQTESAKYKHNPNTFSYIRVTGFGREIEGFMHLLVPELPEKKVKPGFNWQLSRTLFLHTSQERVIPLSVRLTYTYLGTRGTAGRKAAVIRVTGQLTDTDSGEGYSRNALINGEALYDLTEECIVDTRLRMEMTMESRPENGRPVVLGRARTDARFSFGIGALPKIARYHPLHGPWRQLHREADGKKLPESRSYQRWRVFDTRFVNHMTSRYQSYARGRFVLRPDVAPNAIDFEDTSPSGFNVKRGVERGIYKIEGNRMTICAGFSGNPRPSDFSTFPKSRRYLIHFERIRNFNPPKKPNVVVLKPKREKPKPKTIADLTPEPDIEIEPDLAEIPPLKPVVFTEADRFKLFCHYDVGSKINRSAISPDGKSALVTIDEQIEYWDLESGKVTNRFRGFKEYINAIKWLPDGKRFVAGGHDGHFRIWNLNKSEPEFQSERHDGSITALAVSPNGKYVVAGSNNGTVRLWDVTAGTRIRRLELEWYIIDLDISPDGTDLIICRGGSGPDRLTVWDVKTGHYIRSLDCRVSSGSYAMFSPDGKSIFARASGGDFKRFDRQTGEVTLLVEKMGGQQYAVTPDGNHLISPAGSSGFQYHRIEPYKSLGLGGHHECGSWWSSISADGKRVLVHLGNKMHLFGLEADTLYAKKAGERAKLPQRISTIEPGYDIRGPMAISQDGKLFVTSTKHHEDLCLRVWDTKTGKLLRRIATKEGTDARAVAISADAKWVACAGGGPIYHQGKIVKYLDINVHVFDLNTGEEKYNMPGHERWVTQMAFSPDGKWLISGGYDGTCLWNMKEGKLEKKFKTQGNGVASLSIAPDSTRAAALSGGRLFVFDLPNARLLYTSKRNGFPHFSPDSKRILTINEDGLKVLDVGNGKELSYIKDIGGRNPTFSKDGRYGIVMAASGPTTLVDLKTGQRVYDLPLGGHSSRLAPDGRHFYVHLPNYLLFYSFPEHIRKHQ